MATPILLITELADGQIDQFATANEAFRYLEAAANAWLEVDVSGGDATVTNTSSDDYAMLRHQVFSVTGHTAIQSVTFSANKRVFRVYNASDTYATNVVIGATSIAVPTETMYTFWADGTTNGLIRAE